MGISIAFLITLKDPNTIEGLASVQRLPFLKDKIIEIINNEESVSIEDNEDTPEKTDLSLLRDRKLSFSLTYGSTKYIVRHYGSKFIYEQIT